jgi:hypothetical protein
LNKTGSTNPIDPKDKKPAENNRKINNPEIVKAEINHGLNKIGDNLGVSAEQSKQGRRSRWGPTPEVTAEIGAQINDILSERNSNSNLNSNLSSNLNSNLSSNPNSNLNLSLNSNSIPIPSPKVVKNETKIILKNEKMLGNEGEKGGKVDGKLGLGLGIGLQIKVRLKMKSRMWLRMGSEVRIRVKIRGLGLRLRLGDKSMI